MRRRDKFDHIIIETTGLADPGPVAQTFFVDDEIWGSLRLDGIVTLVDAHHVNQQIERDVEVAQQIAFADVILINKIDLVSVEDVDALESRLRQMNGNARIFRTENALTDIERVVNIGGFDLDRALEVNPAFMEPEYPFEWAGAYQLAAGEYHLNLGEGPDPTMKVLLESLPAASEEALSTVQDQALVRFTAEGPRRESGERLQIGPIPAVLLLPSQENRFHFRVEQPGSYVLWTEHGPDEFALEILESGHVVAPLASREYLAGHEHDDEITSVGITIPGNLDADKLNGWLRHVLRFQGPDIYRMKGVLSIAGEHRRFVFQGVHMLFDGRPDRLWGQDERVNRLVFIGRNLDRAALNDGFRACLV
jgi:G3E family GTPase